MARRMRLGKAQRRQGRREGGQSSTVGSPEGRRTWRRGMGKSSNWGARTAMARACGRRLGPRPSTIDAMARQREDDAHARDDEGVRLRTRRDKSGLSEADVEALGSPVFGGHGRRSARGRWARCRGVGGRDGATGRDDEARVCMTRRSL
ncbi:hypothetical protein EJB05_06276, partial [Eragrostis curvula]